MRLLLQKGGQSILEEMRLLWVLLVFGGAFASLEDILVKGWQVKEIGGERFVDVNERWSAFGTMLVSAETDPGLLYPVSVVFCIVNRNGWWYQTRPFKLSGRRTFKIDLSNSSGDWYPSGHTRPWDGFARWNVMSFGVKVFPHRGSVRVSISDVTLLLESESRGIKVLDLSLPAKTYKNEQFEIAFRLNWTPRNPFDPTEVDIRARFEHNGVVESVPGFFYQDFIAVKEGKKRRLVPKGASCWKVRFTPHSTGKLSYYVEIKTKKGKAEFQGGLSVESQRELKRTPFTPEDDFIVGKDAKYGVAYALREDWVPLKFFFSAEGLKAWRAPIEWTEAWGEYAGAGTYSLEVSWLLDKVLENAEHSLPLVLCENEPFGNRKKFNWKDNPLNAVNGGPLKVPSEFYTNEQAFELLKRRLRYIIARWGGHPRVSGWEVWLDIPAPGVEKWHKRLGEFLRQWALPAHPIRSYHPQASELLEVASISDFEHDIAWSVAYDIARREAKLKLSGEYTSQGKGALSLQADYPGETAIRKVVEEDWSGFNRLAFDIYIPPDAPSDMRVMIYLRDPDLWWYESLLEPYLRPGDWTRLIVDLTGRSTNWVPQGHSKPYSPQILWRVREIGLRFFGHRAYKGAVYIDNINLWKTKELEEPLKIVEFSTNRQTVPRYEKFEITLTFNKTFRNPFDPDVVDLQVHFLTPSGRVLNVPGFFYQPYRRSRRGEREALVAEGASKWKIRFAPTELGKYRYYITLNKRSFFEKDGVGEKSFECIPSKSGGFARLSASDLRYFEFDNGEFFYPIGQNLRSPIDSRQFHIAGKQPEGQGTYAYDLYFERMVQNGMNWTRVWMCPWWCGLEWTKKWPGYHGVGYFNLENAWRLDYIVEKAEKLGVYMELCLINHGQFSVDIDRQWKDNPYNRRRKEGGMLERAQDFFTDPSAEKAIKKRFRYAVARWGYSTAVMNWALFSEVEFAEIYWQGEWDSTGWKRCPMLRDWHQRLASYLKSIDPQRRLITTHFSHPWRGRDIWSLRELEFVQSNAYSAFSKFGTFSARNAVSAMNEYYTLYSQVYGKPSLVAEWGGHWMKNEPVPLEAELHCGLWSALTTPLAGNTGFWWWHFTDKFDKYFHYRALARFMKGEDRRGKRLRTLPCPATRPLKAQALVGETQADVWVYHPSILYDLTSAPTVRGARVEIMGLKPGGYSAEFWNTFTGELIGRTTVRTPVVISLPEVRGDIAIKVRRLEGEA